MHTLSIIAVHGLNGDPISTWTKSDNCWLRDFLPQDVVGARILSFGYNADVAFGNTTADIVDHAKDLLGSLIDKREGDDVSHPLQSGKKTKTNSPLIETAEADYIHRALPWWYCGKTGRLWLSLISLSVN